jgi:hypothetical protein
MSRGFSRSSVLALPLLFWFTDDDEGMLDDEFEFDSFLVGLLRSNLTSKKEGNTSHDTIKVTSKSKESIAKFQKVELLVPRVLQCHLTSFSHITHSHLSHLSLIIINR